MPHDLKGLFLLWGSYAHRGISCLSCAHRNSSSSNNSSCSIPFVLTTIKLLVCCLYVLEHFSQVDADPHEVALWVLLKRTQSPNKAIRLHAVQELAENHHWHGKSHKVNEII